MANRELNDVKINVEFQETANRQQISSGDEIKTLFGKIKKWFSDLKTVAFTGMYSDLKRTPYIPNTCSVGNHDTSGYKYFPILTVWPAGDETESSAVVYFDIFNFDWDTSYERVAVHFASWDRNNYYYIDGMGCTSVYKFGKNIDYSSLLFGVSDSVDPYCIEVWIKVPQYNGFGIKLFAAGSYDYATGETWTDYADYGGDMISNFVYVNPNPTGYTRANLPEYVTSGNLFFGSLT